MKKILKKIKDIYVSELNGDADKIDLGTDLSDLGLDSIDIYELILLLEEKFDVEIPDSEYESFLKVKDIVEYINNNTDAGDDSDDEE